MRKIRIFVLFLMRMRLLLAIKDLGLNKASGPSFFFQGWVYSQGIQSHEYSPHSKGGQSFLGESLSTH
jgi:hypothetical protein